MQRLLRIVGIASSFLCFAGAFAAAAPEGEPMGVGVAKAEFGKTADGTPVDPRTLTNAHGMKAKIITYGGVVTELDAPDRDGKMGDVVLGFDNLKSYLAGDPYFGALIGRVANRVAKGRFTLGGKEYKRRRTTAPTPCTAEKRGSTRWCGRASRSSRKHGPRSAEAELRQQGRRGGLPRRPVGDGC